MNLFNKPAVKVLLLVELIAIGGYVTNYISLNQLLLVLGVVMLTFGIFVYKWSQAKKKTITILKATGVDEGVDIWEPLPQTLFIEDEILLYGYDHTVANVRFFLDGTIDLTTLDALYIDNILFRVAVIPADFAATINTSNLDEVMSALKIESVGIVR